MSTHESHQRNVVARFPILGFSLLLLLGSAGLIGAQPPPAKPRKPANEVQQAPKDENDLDVRYVPTPQDVVEKMLRVAQVTKDDVVYDLGCGDGRIVVTAAKQYGCKAVGFELGPRRIKESRLNAKIERVDKLVTICKQDLFTVDLSEASVVMLYLHPELNVRLIPQLEKMKPGSRIVSHEYDIEGVTPTRVVRVGCKDGFTRTLYLWVTPLKKGKPRR